MSPAFEGDSIWRDEYLLRSFHVDINQKAFATALFNFMLASAWAHANESDFSYDNLKEDGTFWVLSRFYCEFESIPLWNDTITVETWGKGVDRLFALRDYFLLRADGSKFGAASSAWLILDKQTLKPQRPEKLKAYYKFSTDRDAIKCAFDKLKDPSADSTATPYQVNYSDIDLNRHVSSANYLNWIFNSLPHNFILDNELRSFEINYTAEGHLRDDVEIIISEDKLAHDCSVKRVNDGTTLCRARLIWKQ